MPSKKKGEDRDSPSGEDAARAARRAARDKAFGRSPSDDQDDNHLSGERSKKPASAGSDDAENAPLGALFGRNRGDDPVKDRDDEQSRRREIPGARGTDASKRESGKRRELPMAGSASEVRRLRRSGQDIPAMLELIKSDAIAADIKKKKRLLYGAMVLSGIGIAVFVVAQFYRWSPVIYVTKFSIPIALILFGFAVNDLCLLLARTNPRLACRILSILTFGNANSLRNLAHLYMDQGDYAKAEKTLSSSIGAIDPKRKLRDYILMHALFANLRAHIGRSAEAEQLVREVLNAAEAHNKERQTNFSAFLLANTLNYAAQLCDVTDKMHDALALARRAVKLLCDHDMPPPDVTLVALYNAGYYCNVLGEFQEAMLYLTKAQELATKTGIARDGELAFIYSNLAIANLGVGRSTQCKRLLNDAETRAMTPLGMSERPHTYQCWAIYHFANDRLEYSLQAYEKAIDYCSQQSPKESVFLLRIIKEYSVLLRELGKTREATANEQRVTQIRNTLHTLSVYVPTKKERKIKPLKVPVTKKARFPIFYLLLAGFWGFGIWNEGVRLAPFMQWLFFLTTLAVVAIKIRAKYGPPVKEETSQGAVIAIVSFIPGLRSVVPELSLIPKKTGGIIIGAAVGTAALVHLTAPAPNMVPDSGLLGQEYLVLGDGLREEESFNKARKAYELAAKYGAGPIASMKLIREIPKNVQPDAAIEDNMQALEVSKEKGSKSAKARLLWEQCVEKYPDFEYPYVHLAALINPNDLSSGIKDALAAAKARKSAGKKQSDELETTSDTSLKRANKRAKAHEAEALLKKALAINPDLGIALLEMCSVKQNLGDTQGRIKFAKRYIAVTGDSDPMGKLVGEQLAKSDTPDLDGSAATTSSKANSDSTKDAEEDSSKPDVSQRKDKVRSPRDYQEVDERFESTSATPKPKVKSAEAKESESEDESSDSADSNQPARTKKFVVNPGSVKDASAKTAAEGKAEKKGVQGKENEKKAVPATLKTATVKPPATSAKSGSTSAQPSSTPSSATKAKPPSTPSKPSSPITKPTKKSGKHSGKKIDTDILKFTPDDTDW